MSRVGYALVMVIVFSSNASLGQSGSAKPPAESVTIEEYMRADTVSGVPRTPENDKHNTEVARFAFMRCAAVFQFVATVFSKAPDPEMRRKEVDDNLQRAESVNMAVLSLKPAPDEAFVRQQEKAMTDMYLRRAIAAGGGFDTFFKNDALFVSDMRFCNKVVSR